MDCFAHCIISYFKRQESPRIFQMRTGAGRKTPIPGRQQHVYSSLGRWIRQNLCCACAGEQKRALPFQEKLFRGHDQNLLRPDPSAALAYAVILWPAHTYSRYRYRRLYNQRQRKALSCHTAQHSSQSFRKRHWETRSILFPIYPCDQWKA